RAGARRADPLRRQPARADQPRAGVAGAGADSRPRLRRRRRPPRAREGRAPPPPRPLVPGARRGGKRRRDPRPRARAGAAAAGRSLADERRVKLGVAERLPEKPGPGPISEGLLRALDITVARRMEGLLAGDYRSRLLGQGSELAQIRPYLLGDDVRQIDWNVTARTGEPHVRVQHAERVLVTWLVLDTSPSMAFGTADRRKADVAEGVAVAVGHVATRRGNRLGVVTFGDAEPRSIPVRQGRRGLIALLSALREEHESGDKRIGATSLGEAIRRADALARQRALVVVVSDFRGPNDWRR